MEHMGIDNKNNGSALRERENGFHLRPVEPDESGEGLPYAPEDWPNSGDVWGWRVGRRVATTGHFLDRYLYLPSRLCHLENSTRKKHGFASKLSVERYIRNSFPNADVAAFFASFSWRIPAKKQFSISDNLEGHILIPVPLEDTEDQVSDSQSDSISCKAGNKMCGIVMVQGENPPLPGMPCDVCCSEPRFCRDCCCILCCKTVNSNYGSYSYIKCEAAVGEDYICGHIAHINCALRAYMAGTVGGSIGLDAEYYCRRCDARTDLVSHVKRFLKICESIDSRDDIEKILNIGICILRGSQKASAKDLLNRVELAIIKLKCGFVPEDIQDMEDDTSAIPDGISHNGNADPEVTNDQNPPDVRTSSPLPIMSIPSDYQIETLKLEGEIYQALQALRKSQESEYQIAEEQLNTHKRYLHDLYQQLDMEKAELSRRISNTDPDFLLNAVLSRVDQVNKEVMKLKEMLEVANGFGKTPKGILKKHFGLETMD